MSGHIGPITCCDRDCAIVNACRIGGVPCEGCGRYFCAIELDENRLCGVCDEFRTMEDDDEVEQGEEVEE